MPTRTLVGGYFAFALMAPITSAFYGIFRLNVEDGTRQRLRPVGLSVDYFDQSSIIDMDLESRTLVSTGVIPIGLSLLLCLFTWWKINTF